MHPEITRRNLVLTAALTSVGFGAGATAPEFPEKPIELYIPYPPGGSTDQVGRAFADASRKHLSQPFIVVNKPGASGSIATSEIINSKPDGYRIGMLTPDVLSVPLLGMAKFSHTDLEPIAQINYDPATLVVRADSPWSTVQEFIATARKNKGTRIGTSGNGTLNHIATAALSDKTGLDLIHVPFQGSAPAVLSLLGGHIEAVFVTPSEVMSHIQAGKLRMIVQLGDNRAKAAMDVPTGKESGLDIKLGSWRYLAVSKKTPPTVVAKLRKIASDVATDPVLRASLEKMSSGYEYRTGEEFSRVLTRDEAVFKDLIVRLNIKP